MTWTDESGNPECECGHLWSNHHQKIEIYFCEAPDCTCGCFNETSLADRMAHLIYEMEESEVVEEERKD